MQRRDIPSTVCRSAEEVRQAEREFLRKLTPEQRILLTWQLSEEQWKAKGVDEPGLSRFHTRVFRHGIPIPHCRAYAVNLYVDPRATGNLDRKGLKGGDREP